MKYWVGCVNSWTIDQTHQTQRMSCIELYVQKQRKIFIVSLWFLVSLVFVLLNCYDIAKLKKPSYIHLQTTRICNNVNKTRPNIRINFYLTTISNPWWFFTFGLIFEYKLSPLIFLAERHDVRSMRNSTMWIIISPLSATYFYVFHVVVGAPISSQTMTNSIVVSVGHKHSWRNNQGLRHFAGLFQMCFWWLTTFRPHTIYNDLSFLLFKKVQYHGASLPKW
jgi:hypothetical protein